MSALGPIFWAVVVLSFLVMVHEGGHFLIARLFGMRVTEFFLGMPCRWRIAHKSEKYGTVFGVTPILLGGYNRVCGMAGNFDPLLAKALGIVQREGRVRVDALASELDIEVSHAYELMVALEDLASIQPYYDPELGETPHQKDWPAAFQTLRRDAKMRNEYDRDHDFSAEGTTQAGEPRPTLDPEGLLDSEVRRTFAGKAYPKRLLVLLAGPLVNILVAFALVVGIQMVVGYDVYVNDNVLGEVAPESLAADAGLKAGDKIVSVQGTEVADWVGLVDQVQVCLDKGESFEVTYERGGKQATTTITLPEGKKVDRVGIAAPTTHYRPGFIEASETAVGYTALVGKTLFSILIPQHTAEVVSQSSSVVGMSVMMDQAASAGAADLLLIVAAISMSLGFMNLLPLLPLDGGRIIIETIQAVTRKRVPIKVQNIITYVTLAALLVLFVVALRNDIIRFILV